MNYEEGAAQIGWRLLYRKDVAIIELLVVPFVFSRAAGLVQLVFKFLLTQSRIIRNTRKAQDSQKELPLFLMDPVYNYPL